MSLLPLIPPCAKRSFFALLVGISLFQLPPSGLAQSPVNALQLRQSLEHLDTDEARAALHEATQRLFGRGALLKGPVPPRMEGTTVAWAILSPEDARVVRADGMVLGTMTRLGSDGLQLLALDIPNFTNLDYRIEAGDKTVIGGSLRIEHIEYPPESLPNPEVPQGELSAFEWNSSQVFPKTERKITVYLPAGLDRSKPLPLMVWQDGSRHADRNGQLRVPNVFDSLIHSHAMPPTVGIFIDPGRNAGQRPDGKAANRGFEYDSLGPAYVTFLETEILPEVERRYSLKFTTHPALRAIGGGSSGGICAFTAAWERPDRFARVLSWVGSFVDLRGGHAYPSLIRTTERKPIRIYLLDGENDLDNPFGNWPIANKMMAAALDYMDYDFHIDWTQCFHGSKGMAPYLPAALTWLWRGWDEAASTASR
ncbi:MAG: hypothetical protein KDK99_14040 [Verrucomicrobiales bacterium]|nr:hypothetical protein [Verrucomicrobiales bacterium]